MLKSILMIIVACCMGAFSPCVTASQEVATIKDSKCERLVLTQPFKATFNDATFIITLDNTEVGYTYVNTNDYLVENYSDISEMSFEYNSYGFSFSTFTLGSSNEPFYWRVEDDGASGSYLCIQKSSNRFIYIDDQGETNYLNSPLTINVDCVIYDDFKQAIELDLQANSTDDMPSIADIFTEISSAVTSFIGTLVSAFNGVTALFYDATNGWTFLGVLVLIGCGVGLVYLAYRVIKGLMHRV